MSTDRLTEGASVSRNARIEISVSKTNQKMILTYVRRRASIASQGSALPPRSGEADTKEKEIISFYYFKYLFAINLCRILRSL